MNTLLIALIIVAAGMLATSNKTVDPTPGPYTYSDTTFSMTDAWDFELVNNHTENFLPADATFVDSGMI